MLLAHLHLTDTETRAIARELREDYERDRLNSARVKANILQAIAALHDNTPRPGPLTEEVTPRRKRLQPRRKRT